MNGAPTDGETPRLLDDIDAVLFDLDGTLLDTAGDLVQALHSVCAEESQTAPDATLAARYVSTGAIGLVRLAFPHAPADTVERLRQRLVAHYETKLCVHTEPYPGVVELLGALHARDIPWGIVTNKMRYLAAPLLEQLHLHAHCATLVGGDTATHNKPHPAPLLHALEELGVTPARALYVGDAEKDILAGQAAGTGTVAATWGYILPDQDPRCWNADYTIDHPQEMLALGARR